MLWKLYSWHNLSTVPISRCFNYSRTRLSQITYVSADLTLLWRSGLHIRRFPRVQRYSSATERCANYQTEASHTCIISYGETGAHFTAEEAEPMKRTPKFEKCGKIEDHKTNVPELVWIRVCREKCIGHCRPCHMHCETDNSSPKKSSKWERSATMEV